MQTSQHNCATSGVHGFLYQHAPDITPYCSSHYQVFDNNMYPNNPTQGNQISFQNFNEEYITLDSGQNAGLYNIYDSPSGVSTSSNRSQFSPQGSQSYISDPPQSSDNTYGSPMSNSSVVDDNTELRNQLRELERSLMGPDSPRSADGHYCSLSHGGNHGSSSNQLMEMLPKMDLKQVLYLCAQAVSEKDVSTAETLMDALGKMVSVCGTPMQRLAAYMLEGLRARLESSGYTIYKKLRCEQPTSSELLTYMHILYQVCPYFKFAYMSSNLIIQEAVGHERSIHIIDFQIGMGTQWISLIQSLGNRPGGPPLVRITGVDDSQSAYARGAGLELVEKRLLMEAKKCNVPFEFHAAAMSGCQVKRENLSIRPGEALTVNFPYMLHHMPDESVSTANHRDRLLRLVKELSPRIVTVVEQESNTNTSPFLNRFAETLDYYTAMYESVDVALARDDKKRINAEMHCLARDIVNMIACEDAERVERHEPFGKWRARLSMAGFTQLPLSYTVIDGVRGLLKEFHGNYRLQEWHGALFLGWKNRILSSSSAWR
ncbi:scarecrow-like protein 13 [Chenopodium quinoa]|uniref:scarecrow-like protein 13 n=1 Tax=Chenopodium quinoa TaxID=63459 RepID=UPI000B77EF8B|nr:scarecrow-like protein 13 [Chenopodium quinoa]